MRLVGILARTSDSSTAAYPPSPSPACSVPVDLGNGVTLDYYEKRDEPIQSQHYTFLVPDEQFDAVITRLEVAGVTYYADPGHTEPGQTNRLFGGRGAYFDDPDGHNVEVTTRSYVRP
ncbi:VOC family protein [Streptomyces sp. NPDC101455]|uniref:VOC family protein n=1 Tax=Streptomyces sp. NPDC101455 TaxID=3366142 RepID=UPI00382DD574